MERTIVLYHGNCGDGFGAALAAWKKLGDTVEYIPLSRGEEIPEGLAGATLYFLDFTYDKETMDKIVATAKSVTVLDHHEGVKDVIESMPTFVYDKERSGATIAWSYFHPDTPVPLLLRHIQDEDTYQHRLADTPAVRAYLDVREYDFAEWDELMHKLENPETREEMLKTMRIYAEYFELLAQVAIRKAKKVSFEGYTCLFGTSHPMKSIKSYVGNLLAREMPPISLTVTAHPNGYGVSIRGDGSVNVAELAQKYGGNGHYSAAGFLIPRTGPFPWTLIEDEDSSD